MLSKKHLFIYLFIPLTIFGQITWWRSPVRFSPNARPNVGSAITFDDTRGVYTFPALYILNIVSVGNPPRFSVINCSTYATYQLPSPPFIITDARERLDIAFAGVNYGTVAYGWVFAVGRDQSGNRKLYRYNTITSQWAELGNVPITTGEWLTGNCITQGGTSYAYGATYWDFWVIGGNGSREFWCFHHRYPSNPTTRGIPAPEYFWERKADFPSSEEPYHSGATLTYGYFCNPQTSQPDTGILLSPSGSDATQAKRFYGYSISRNTWYRLQDLLSGYENWNGACIQCEYYDPPYPRNDIYLQGHTSSGYGSKKASTYFWANYPSNCWENNSQSYFPFLLTSSDMAFGKAWVIPPAGGSPEMRSGVITVVAKYFSSGAVGSCTLYLGKSQPAPEEGGGQSISLSPIEEKLSIIPNPMRKGDFFQVNSRENEMFFLYDAKGNILLTLKPKKRCQIKNAGVYFITTGRKRAKLLVY
ncbi:MAG: hypothetical protein ABIK97_06745 [candidate division WOR-3 bacterium]